MSIFSSIGKFFKKIFNFVKDLLRKIVTALGPFLPLLIIAAFVFAPYIAGYLASWGFPAVAEMFATVYTTISAFGEYAMLAVGVGVSFLVAPEETTKLISSVASVIGKVTSSVAGAVGSTVGSFISSLGIWAYVIGGAGLYWLLKDNSTTIRTGGSSD